MKGLFEFRQRREEESGGRITSGFPGNLYTHTEWIAAINSRRKLEENVLWTRIIYDLPWFAKILLDFASIHSAIVNHGRYLSIESLGE